MIKHDRQIYANVDVKRGLPKRKYYLYRLPDYLISFIIFKIYFIWKNNRIYFLQFQFNSFKVFLLMVTFSSNDQISSRTRGCVNLR
jgi:hypothetical protein